MPLSLFDASLISPEVKAALPAGFIVRPLADTDYEKGRNAGLGWDRANAPH